MQSSKIELQWIRFRRSVLCFGMFSIPGIPCCHHVNYIKTFIKRVVWILDADWLIEESYSTTIPAFTGWCLLTVQLDLLMRIHYPLAWLTRLTVPHSNEELWLTGLERRLFINAIFTQKLSRWIDWMRPLIVWIWKSNICNGRGQHSGALCGCACRCLSETTSKQPFQTLKSGGLRVWYQPDYCPITQPVNLYYSLNIISPIKKYLNNFPPCY